MPLIFKSKLSSSVTNQTFVDKTIDDKKKGKLGLFKVNDQELDYVDDVQVFLNNLADTIGQFGQEDTDAKVYQTNNIITDGESRKQALEAFDIAVKQNIDDITELEDKLNDGARIAAPYSTDTEYELDNPTLVGGEFYYNTTTGLIRYYSNIESEWKPVGAQAIGSQSLLGIGNGTNTDFTLPTIPVSDEYVVVYLNGIVVEKTDYSISSSTITFINPPSTAQRVYASWVTDGTPASPPVTSGSFEVEYIQITSVMIANRSLTLSQVPAQPAKVMLDVVQGSTQIYGVDYTVSLNNLSWDALGLQPVITLNDTVRVFYIT